MSLAELEQAVFATKWGNAEEDAIEVIARAMELPVGVVERVLFAAGAVRERRKRGQQKFGQLSESMFEGPTLPLELREAIGHAVESGMKRAAVRHVIQNDYKLYVRPSKLVGDRPRDICNGCPHSIECLMIEASTPEKCVKRGVLDHIRREGDRVADMRRSCIVTPQKIVGDKVTVTCDHPTGTWTLDVEDFDL